MFRLPELLSYRRKVLGTDVYSTVRARKNGVNEYPQPLARERGLFNFRETCPVRHTKRDDDTVLLFKGFCATKEQFESAEFRESLNPDSESFVERFVFSQDWYQNRVGFRLAASPNRAANYARNLLSESLVKSYLAVYDVGTASTLMRGKDFDSQWFEYLGIGEDVFLYDITNLRFVGAYELYFPKSV